MSRPIFAWALCLSLATSLADAQHVETGFLNRMVTVAGHSYGYQVYVPSNYVSEGTWPVILFLHGAGARGVDGLLPTTAGLGDAIRLDPTRYPAIVVFPQAPADSQWVGATAEMALTALTQTMDEFRVDPDRVYLTGFSMGGYGTWYLAYRHADLFAGVAPICGFVVHPRAQQVVPADSGEVYSALARRLANTPIWIFHGEMDGVVPVRASREPAAALEAVSANVSYTEYPGLGHNVWEVTYASDEFTRWLFAHRRR